MITGVVSGGQICQGVILISDLQLGLRLRMSKPTKLLPLYAFITWTTGECGVFQLFRQHDKKK
jgi:hypothetical protein